MTAAVSSTDEVVEVDPCSDRYWSRLVETHPSDVFHAPAWGRVLQRTYGFVPRARLVLGTAGVPRSGLVYVDVDDARGRRLVSLPFSDFCDPVVSRAGDWDLLVEGLPTDSVPSSLRCLRHGLDDERWRETASYAWHRIDVARDEEAVLGSVDPTARRAIRKARAAGVEVAPAAHESDLRAFFELHLRVRKAKYGLLAQPWRFFQSIWEEFLLPGAGVLLLARLDGEVIGGVLYLEWKETLYYKFNASSSNHLDARPNDLLAWEGIAHARQRGLQWFDFGVSDWDQEGLVRYKRKYATEEGVVRKFSAGPPPADRLGPTLGEVTRLLVDPSVPDPITEMGGDLLYGLFA